MSSAAAKAAGAAPQRAEGENGDEEEAPPAKSVWKGEKALNVSPGFPLHDVRRTWRTFNPAAERMVDPARARTDPKWLFPHDGSLFLLGKSGSREWERKGESSPRSLPR